MRFINTGVRNTRKNNLHTYVFIDSNLNIFQYFNSQRKREKERERGKIFILSYICILIFLKLRNFSNFFKHIYLLSIIFLCFIFVNYNIAKSLRIFESLHFVNYASCQLTRHKASLVVASSLIRFFFL